METVTGFSIEKRKLSQEEISKDITLERFRAFHSAAGEDFADTCGHTFNEKILVGYLIGKQPQISKELLKAINHGGDLNELRNVYIDKLVDADDLFYSDFADFLNLTEHAKYQVNQILIQVGEYYSGSY